MIVYLAKKHEFLDDVDSNKIEDRIYAEFQRTHRRTVGRSEVSSWKNSLNYMQRILSDQDIPPDSGIAIEFGIPQTEKRIDLIVTGRNEAHRQTAIIIELKQWSEAKLTEKDGVVTTVLGGSEIETEHPSYRAWSYAMLLNDFNETVRDRNIALHPCAYLHNCVTGDTINNAFYGEYTKLAPAFLRSDAGLLRSFIKQHVKHGDSGEVIYQIRDGKISPSKSLADCLRSMLQGNREFLMIDDQKLVYETALQLAKCSTASNKQVLIVEGGPGTGKSVVAVNLLVSLTSSSLVAQYVTKNSAPRGVYESKLTSAFKKSRISNLFKGSGAHTKTQPNIFDALIVDEAHRLNEKSGMYQNLGENQIKELINASKCSVFFLDENQRVTLRDIGSTAEITRWAKRLNAKVTKMDLASQFRCNGSDGYLAWVDNTLQIRPTANSTLEGINYDFVVCDSPNELRHRILEKNLERNKARMVAGYCWDWKSKKKRGVDDIEIADHGFSARWNLSKDGGLWIVKPETVNEIGCIHTCQGLELDYVGVIIGPDFIVRNNQVLTDATKRSKMDSSVKGYKKLFKSNPAKAERLADEIIKNTYRTLMTRGQRGCFVYAIDQTTNAYLKAAASRMPLPSVTPFSKYPGLPLRLMDATEVQPFINAVPVYNVLVAAGTFSAEQSVDKCDWVELPDSMVPREGLFVTQVVGESMNRRIPNGSWCLFKSNPAGSRDGKVVLVRLIDKQDPETGGQYTVKIYRSEKQIMGDSWRHSRIILKPDSSHAGFNDIILEPSEKKPFETIGELVAVLGKE